jgi:hypothetical protein
VGYKNKKKGLAATGTQQGSRVTDVCSHVTEAPARRARRQRYYYMQNVQASGNNVVLQYSTVWLITP